MIVVDASVLTDFLLGREPAVDAVLEQTAGRVRAAPRTKGLAVRGRARLGNDRVHMVAAQ